MVKKIRHKESEEAKKTKYYVRAIKRLIILVVWLFIFFLVIMGIIYLAPKVWHLVFG